MGRINRMGDSDTETTWVEQSRNGDHSAFESLMRAHQRMIHSLTFRMTGSLADAKDLTQETFLRAYRQLDTYRGDSKFSSWLCRIAVNACLNWRARENHRTQIHQQWSDETLVAESNPAHFTADAVTLRVQAALNRLPAKQRAAIILTVYEEMSLDEAARAMGCTTATAGWRVFAARARLKQWLKPGGAHHE
jgi:RNA polymerase sigma-70 factor (ECF subfamily)